MSEWVREVAGGKGWGGWVWWGGWVGEVGVRSDVSVGGFRVGGWLGGWVVVGEREGKKEGQTHNLMEESGSGLRVVPARESPNPHCPKNSPTHPPTHPTKEPVEDTNRIFWSSVLHIV